MGTINGWNFDYDNKELTLAATAITKVIYEHPTETKNTITVSSFNLPTGLTDDINLFIRADGNSTSIGFNESVTITDTTKIEFIMEGLSTNTYDMINSLGKNIIIKVKVN